MIKKQFIVAVALLSLLSSVKWAQAQTNHITCQWQGVITAPPWLLNPCFTSPSGCLVARYAVLVYPICCPIGPTNFPEYDPARVYLATNYLTILATNYNGLGPSNALAMATLDLGPTFFNSTSNRYFLRMALAAGPNGPWTDMGPDQEILPVAMARYAETISGSISASQINGPLTAAQLSGSYSNPLYLTNANNIVAGNGSGLLSVNAATLGGYNYCNLPCYWNLTGNAGTIPGTDFVGTTDNQPLELRGGGVRVNPGTTNNLELVSGGIKVTGAGVDTATPVFVHRATTANISAHITFIDNPYCNGQPNAILLVTHNWSQDTAANRYEVSPVGVYYTGTGWAIFHEDDTTAMPVGRAFNVMVIKP